MSTHQRPLSDAENHILEAVSQIKFGAVQILIHDSKIVQVERTEKRRFDKSNGN